MVLVPKVLNPRRVHDYRPISLINSFTKLLTKAIANRIGKLVDKIVDEHQFGFTKGRQAVKSILLVQEVYHVLKQDAKKCLILKLDFEKAFDSISWDFLWQNMKSLGFGEKLIGRLKKLFHSIIISVLINGSPTEEFKVSNGVRQGDPLSPLLFNLAAGVLSNLINRAKSLGLLKGIQLGSNKEQLTHLQYGDDTIIFLNEDVGSILTMKRILQCFQLLSGLKINFHKS